MKIAVLGINHKNAPVEVREKLAFVEKEIPDALLKLQKKYSLDETVILSTCNRVEIYACQLDETVNFGDIQDFLSDYHQVTDAEFAPYMYKYRDVEAIEHLFMVASSADSLVLGETQILSQVKVAYQTSKQAGSAGRWLGPLFERALNVGKEVHTLTGIGRRRVSVSSVAVDLAERIFTRLDGCSILVLGAGEMSELTLKNMIERGASTVMITNRTHEKAESLARRVGGTAFAFQDLAQNLAKADIVITGTSSTRTLIKPNHIRDALRLRRYRPIFLIDIAVPRDIDPEVNEIEHAYLYDIDDLEKVVAENLAERKKEISYCQKLIGEKVSEFVSELQIKDAGPVIAKLIQMTDDIRQRELDRAMNKVGPLSDKDKQEIEYLTKRIINKVLNSPISAIRKASASGNGFRMIDATERLFELGEELEDNINGV